MKIRVLVEATDSNGKTHRKMVSIEVPPRRFKLIESMHGDDAIKFVLDEAITGATGAFQVQQQQREVISPKAAPKQKLDEVFGLDIIQNIDRQESSGGGAGVQQPMRPQPPRPQPAGYAQQQPSMPMGPGPIGFGPHRGK